MQYKIHDIKQTIHSSQYIVQKLKTLIICPFGSGPGRSEGRADIFMAVLYISKGKPLCFMTVLYSSSSSSFFKR